jgi:hypothetical protein
LRSLPALIAGVARIIGHRRTPRPGPAGIVMDALILIGAYLVLVVIGQAIGFGLNLVLAAYVPWLALPAFLTIFMAMFWVAWPIAVRITEPRASKSPASPGPAS